MKRESAVKWFDWIQVIMTACLFPDHLELHI